jgi:hypothetical protein
MKRRKSGGRPDTQNPGAAEEWNVTRLVDERTEDSFIGVDFPKRLGGAGFEVVDEDLTEAPAKVRLRLKKRGALLQGTQKEQIQFVSRQIQQAPSEPLILAMKPGFRDDGFVLGTRMLGSAKGRYRWRTTDLGQGIGEVGDRQGDRESWNRDVGKVARKSSYLTFAISAGLAACLPSYVLDRTKTPLLPETAVFNFSGDSGSGKTVLDAAIAGLVGPSRLIAKWEFSRRGLEELAEARHDVPFTLDDFEKFVEAAGISPRTALRWVNQIISSGNSKHLSKVAELPFLRWSTFGFTSSPKSLGEIAADINWRRSKGEQVRFIDIPVGPVSKGGIFDRLEGSDVERVEQGKSLIKQLEPGLAQNYGLIYPVWINFLLEEDRSRRLVKLTNEFVERVAGFGDGWDERFARKFGVIEAAGRLATEAKIVPWPDSWSSQAVLRCYRRAVRATRTDEELAEKTIRLIASLSQNPERFPRVGQDGPTEMRFDDRTLGIRTMYRRREVCGMRDEQLYRLAGGRVGGKAVIRELRQRDVLVGGHGHAGTTQLPVTIEIGDEIVTKPRFWVLDVERLIKAAELVSKSARDR